MNGTQMFELVFGAVFGVGIAVIALVVIAAMLGLFDGRGD